MVVFEESEEKFGSGLDVRDEEGLMSRHLVQSDSGYGCSTRQPTRAISPSSARRTASSTRIESRGPAG